MDDYKKQAKSDISLKKGKMVEVIEKRECGECFILSLIFEYGLTCTGTSCV